MLKMFRKRSENSSNRASVPPGTRYYAIGDIHGRLDLLDTLLPQIERDNAARTPADSTLIFLGDLIDRGPESAGVVERACTIAANTPGVRFLMGNHEEVFLKALDGDVQAMRFFCRIGGRETILSYGMTEADYLKADYEDLVAAMQHCVPESHRRFIESFEDMIIAGDYVFVHAGVRPGVPLADQRPSDLRWIREKFTESRATHDHIVVHGHTIMPEAELLPNRIGIDTGAHASGKLTCLGLEAHDRWIFGT